jgi:hypothetical protein
VTYDINAFVDATDSSRPQFKKTPHFSSRASVLITLFTTLIRVRACYLARRNGINKSIVSPDCEMDRNPPCLMPSKSVD